MVFKLPTELKSSQTTKDGILENLGYSKNCQSIVEKGKRPDEQDVGVEGQVQVLTA